MSHELTMRRDGQVEMAYTHEIPWHGLGTRVEVGSPIEQWITAAGMEWTAEEANVEYNPTGLSGDLRTVVDRKVLYRSDTAAPLGIVSADYHRVQPQEVIEFFRDLIESLGLNMATAGTLFGGRKMWATGFIGEESVVDDRDLVRGYLLLSTSLDGSMASTARFTSTRVVCNNTLQMAHGETGGRPIVRVLHSTNFNASKVKEKLGVAPKTYQAFMSDIRKLANREITGDVAESLCEKLELTEDGKNAKRVMELFAGEAAGSEFTGSEGTAWGWLNAVTQFVDHDRKAMSDSHRMNSATFGRGDTMKSNALKIALSLVD